MKKHFYILTAAIIATSFFGGFFSWMLEPSTTNAETVSDLQGKIDDHNSRIAELEKEIAEYERQIATTGKQAKSLQSEVARLNAERQKLLNEIKVTENKIAAVGFTIVNLGEEIMDKEKKIVLNESAIGATIKKMNERESQSTLEILLANESLADALSHIDMLEQFERSIREELRMLRNLKTDLETKKEESQARKRELESLKDKYGDQRAITEINKREKDLLLAATKNQEAKYREELAEKKRLKDQFEAQLLEFESQLKIAVDPNSIPSAGSGVLNWPLANVTITQQFGDTDFSRSNPGVYNGNGHNGIDLRASRGTAVFASASGVVQGTGNTDVQAGCYSYGKWVLIKHSNGLSTLYAHLDLIKVSAGQEVNSGDIVGYSGNTGYSTGPHLHFTVYASQGVKIVRMGDYRAKTNCSNVSIPVADLKAYLNPLLYLKKN